MVIQDATNASKNAKRFDKVATRIFSYYEIMMLVLHAFQELEMNAKKWTHDLAIPTSLMKRVWMHNLRE